MKVIKPLQDWPLRTQLMVAFAVLSLATTAISTVTLATLARQRMTASLQERSARISQRLQHQLEPVLAAKDSAAAARLFTPYVGDREMDGIALYSADGTAWDGRGAFPQFLNISHPGRSTTPGHINEVVPVGGPNGGGLLYLSFSTRLIDQSGRRDAWTAAGIGATVVICALLLALRVSRGIAGRLVSIADAAKRMQSGDLTSANLNDRAGDEIGALAHAFNSMVAEMSRLSKEHERLILTERERLEALVSERTGALEQSREMFRLMAESTRAIPFTIDLTMGSFNYIGALASADTGIPEAEWKAPNALDSLFGRDVNPEIRQRFDSCTEGPFEFVTPLTLRDGRRREMRWTGTCERTKGTTLLRGLIVDITEFRRMGRELAAAQKLESVGRLAAGVAHEINTPVQFVTDNVNFVRESMRDLNTVIEAYRDFKLGIRAGKDPIALALQADAAEKSADLDYVLKEIPLAVNGSVEGLQRIATIVRSMKAFAHPDQAQKTMADINQAIQSTLIIAGNEYKYVAEVETDLGDLPQVQCYLGEINQVILNLIVNAAHAIGDVHKVTGVRGKIVVRTRVVGDQAEISIADTGTGIPVSARDKLFDPFFTTKEVGKGTGQGLAIAHSVVTKKHSGTLHFDTELGKGTTFFVRIPINAPGAAEEDAAVAA